MVYGLEETMNQSNLIHEQKEKQPTPFWWMTTFIFYIPGFLVSAFLILGPFYALLQLQNFRSLLLFIVVPLGWWLLRKQLRNLGERLWYSRHQSKYRLENNQVSFVEWNNQTHVAKKDTVPFTSISYVVSSYYVLEDNHFHPKSKMGDFIPPDCLAYVLYIVYSKNGEHQMASVPFYPHKEESVGKWLHIFQTNNIPLFYTETLLYLDGEKERLDFFENEEDEVIPYTFEEDAAVEN